MKQLSSAPARLVCLVLTVILTLESAAFTGVYLYSFSYLQQHNPREGTGRAEMRVYFRPRSLESGQVIELREIVRHLGTIGFEESEGNVGGTFSIKNGTLTINSRLKEFPSASITFANHRIVSIHVLDQRVESVQIEPQAMVSFMHYLPSDVGDRMRVRRTILNPDEVPEILSDAICASEDRRFLTSNGIDELGMISGVISGRGGGSGITQQLIKNDVLDDTSSQNVIRKVVRKTKEIPLALAATRLMTKPEIMAAYASNCYMGHVPNGPTIQGMEAAAFELFGKKLKDADLAESAMLAGWVDQPENYLRWARQGDHARLIRRRARVLNLMHRNQPSKYTEEMVAHAKAEPLEFYFASERNEQRPLDMYSKHFQLFAANQIRELLGPQNDGNNVRAYTTLDPDFQTAAHEAVMQQLIQLDNLVTIACRRQGVDPTKIKPIQAALVAIDAQTGEILAMVGGRDGEFNYALARRSQGSIFKSFVYLTAIESGWHHNRPFTAATLIDPTNDPVEGTYRPRNHVGVPARARTQLAKSYNGGAVVAAHDAGLSKVRELINILTKAQSEELTGMIAIGGGDVEAKLFDVVAGYTVFPNNGFRVEPTPFTAIYQDEVKFNLRRINPIRVTGAAPAYVTTQMMRSVVQPGGTGAGALQSAGLPSDASIAAKTGSAQVADLAFIGFSPRLVVGVWVGMPDNLPALTMEDGFSGSRSAMPIWAAFMRAVKDSGSDLWQGGFQRPSNVRVVHVNPRIGCVSGLTGDEEYFIEGREPARCSGQ